MRRLAITGLAFAAVVLCFPAAAQNSPAPTPGATPSAARPPAAGRVVSQRELDLLAAEADFKARNYQRVYLNLLPLAHAGEARAQYLLALMSDNGLGPVQLAPRDAIDWYRKAAEQNHPESQFALANAYASGRGVGVMDPVLSMQWLMKAANNEYHPAMVAVANLYDEGLGGLERNRATAAAWIKRAADAGSVDALYFYGLRLETGDGVPKDEKQARAWFHRAAMRGQPAAQLKLGLVGDGTSSGPETNVEAFMWLTLASQRGLDKIKTDAQQAIRAMTPNMMPSEVNEASTRARAWRAEPPGPNTKPDLAYDGPTGLNAPPPAAGAAAAPAR